MKISIVVIAVASIIFIGFGSLDDLSNADLMLETGSMQSTSSEIDQTLLQKKWKLSHYEIFGEKIDLEESEVGDYIHFHADMTFSSVSENELEEGEYKLSDSSIIMTSPGEEGELVFIVQQLSTSELVVTIDDPEDSDAKYFSLHFNL